MEAGELVARLMADVSPKAKVYLRVQCEGDDFARFQKTHSVFAERGIDRKLVASWKVRDGEMEGW